MMESRITGGPTEKLFRARVLGQFDVQYYRCLDTGFIQTETPYWLDQAYQSPIARVDTGLVARNLRFAALTSQLIDTLVPSSQSMLDFGGGFGLFTRLMRDRGYPFLHTDPLCENLFADGFDVVSESIGVRSWDVITMWEVLEHLADPRVELLRLLRHTEYLLCSTVLVPRSPVKDADDWWYFMPETGQHVSFMTLPALTRLATDAHCHLYSDGISNHLFSRRPLTVNPLSLSRRARAGRWLRAVSQRMTGRSPRRESLTNADHKTLLTLMQQEHERSSAS